MADDPTMPASRQTSVVRLRARVTMRSDWRIGVGLPAGAASIQRTARDAHRLPFVPAKTLTGAWREACEQLTMSLDGGRRDGAWSAWAGVLFGPRPADDHSSAFTGAMMAGVRIGPAMLPASLAHAMRGNTIESRRLRQSLTVIRSFAESSHTGCVVAVRRVEFARAGAVLDAAIDLPAWNASQQQTALAILTAAALLIESIGGGRRRGGGACTVELVDAPMSAAQSVAWLRATPVPPAVPVGMPDWNVAPRAATPMPRPVERPTRARKSAFGGSLAPAVSSSAGIPAAQVEGTAPAVKDGSAELASLDDQSWISIPLELTLVTPICIPAQTAGNLITTHIDVPGTQLLPNVSRVLHERVGLETAVVRAAIARGDIVVCEARAEDLQSLYGMSVATQRYSDEGGHARLVQAVMPVGERGHAIRLRSSVRLRVFLARAAARRMGGMNAVATALASEDYRIGHSRKDEYGHVRIAARDWRPVPASQVDLSHNRFSLVFESDTLLLNPHGSYATTIGEIVNWLRRAGISAAQQVQANTAEDAVLHVRRVDGWHGGWGLPRATMVCIAAGDHVSLELKPSISEKERRTAEAMLIQMELDGIGERRAEGFGRVRIGDGIQRPENTETVQPDAAPTSPDGDAISRRLQVRPGDAAHAYARVIERDVWRAELRRSAMRAMCTAAGRRRILGFDYRDATPIPALRQLGTLRYTLSRLLRSLEQTSDKQLTQRLRDQCTEATQWLAGHAGLARRRATWRMVKEQLLWLLDPAQFDSSSPRVWGALESAGGCRFSALMLTSDEEWRLRHELWAEAVRTLIDAGVRAHEAGCGR